jgi:hypothetical protein
MLCYSSDALLSQSDTIHMSVATIAYGPFLQWCVTVVMHYFHSQIQYIALHSHVQMHMHGV